MNCRSCGGPLISVCNLGSQPLANSLLLVPDAQCLTYPLELMACESCQLGQLKEPISPEAMFKEYVYYTSVSSPSVESAKKLVDLVLRDPTIKNIRTVMEVGSNDGYLLQFYKEHGVSVLGVDPAYGPADVAIAKGIPTIKEFFTLPMARQLQKADVIHANNVLAHVPNLDDFVAGLALVLNPEGSLFVEVPYFLNLLNDCEFDTIYHEHTYYFSLRSLNVLFKRHGLFIEELACLGAHGGSLRLRIGRHAKPFRMREDLLSLCERMQRRMDKISSEFKAYMIGLRESKKRVWGFGAAAKATVMLNYCGIDSSLVEYVADATPAKIGKFIPGTGIKIVPPNQWLEAQPDYTCIFPWNFADEISLRYFREYKGTFFTPYRLVKEKVLV